MTDAIRDAWEKRSLVYGSQIEGVLQKSFPKVLNESIHYWMLEQIRRVILKNKVSKVLDVGCGYGRLSAPLLKEFPQLHIDGLDIAKPYVDLYNKSLTPRGKAVIGDISKIPFKNGTFDLVFVVTTLMYAVSINDQERAVSELLRVLKPRGKFIIIERNSIGQNIVTFGGLINKIHGKKSREINAIGFTKDQMFHLIESHNAFIDNVSGRPVWTILLPISFLLAIVNASLARSFLNMISRIDDKLSSLLTLSLYISYTGYKKP